MIRHSSNHQKTNRDNENRAKVMSSVEMFTPTVAAEYARKAVALESRGNGDQLNALERVGRVFGLKSRALRRIINGETMPSLPVFARIREGYLNICERQIQKLQHEVEMERKRYGDAALEDLDGEIKALAEKLRQAKQGR